MLLQKGRIEAHYFIAIIMMMSAFAFTSCIDDEDTDQSMALSGEWRGDFGMFYDYVDRYGRRYTFDSYDTRITFIPAHSYARSGRGTQVDYYDRGPYEYQYYKFSWQVSNGNIYLTYDYDHELDTRISNYRMTNDYFSGTFSSTGTPWTLLSASAISLYTASTSRRTASGSVIWSVSRCSIPCRSLCEWECDPCSCSW